MDKKDLIRKRFIVKRKKKYFQVSKSLFYPLIKLTKSYNKKKKLNMSLYYPSNFELDVLKILDVPKLKKINFLLPIVEDNNSMNFYKWKKSDTLTVNKYGILEPFKSKILIPNIILVPLVAFDKNKNRIGYGKGFYDRYLYKYIKKYKKIVTVGVAFSFQRHHNLPVNYKDFKLDYIITEKGLL